MTREKRHREGDFFVSKRTQQGFRLKLAYRYLELYEVTKALRYILREIGEKDPHQTSSAANCMKP